MSGALPLFFKRPCTLFLYLYGEFVMHKASSLASSLLLVCTCCALASGCAIIDAVSNDADDGGDGSNNTTGPGPGETNTGGGSTGGLPVAECPAGSFCLKVIEDTGGDVGAFEVARLVDSNLVIANDMPGYGRAIGDNLYVAQPDIEEAQILIEVLDDDGEASNVNALELRDPNFDFSGLILADLSVNQIKEERTGNSETPDAVVIKGQLRIDTTEENDYLAFLGRVKQTTGTLDESEEASFLDALGSATRLLPGGAHSVLFGHQISDTEGISDDLFILGNVIGASSMSEPAAIPEFGIFGYDLRLPAPPSVSTGLDTLSSRGAVAKPLLDGTAGTHRLIAASDDDGDPVYLVQSSNGGAPFSYTTLRFNIDPDAVQGLTLPIDTNVVNETLSPKLVRFTMDLPNTPLVDESISVTCRDLDISGYEDAEVQLSQDQISHPSLHSIADKKTDSAVFFHPVYVDEEAGGTLYILQAGDDANRPKANCFNIDYDNPLMAFNMEQNAVTGTEMVLSAETGGQELTFETSAGLRTLGLPQGSRVAGLYALEPGEGFAVLLRNGDALQYIKIGQDGRPLATW